MLQPMIESHGLTKRLGGRTVVSDVSFACAPGTVTGFLGPNGAGKTTTMRMLCGLSDPDAGHAEILGGPYRALPNPGRRVGILLDASAQHAGRRGQETLTLSALTMGADPKRVPELLERVGLREARRAPARQGLLAGHAPAAGHRQRADRRPGGPDPRRARQRPGPRGHALDARPAARLRRPWRHRPALLPPAARGRGGRRPAADHRQRQDRRGGHARRAAGRRRHARARAPTTTPALASAMAAAGLTARAHPEGGFIVEAEPEEVGRAALAGGVALVAPRPVGERRPRAALLRPHQRRAGRGPATSAPADLQETVR